MYCPFGEIGSLLSVREAWCCRVDLLEAPLGRRRHYTRYKADADGFRPDDPNNWHNFGGRWWSPSTMPDWAVRFTLEIVDIRVQRLGDIDWDDAVGEGMTELDRSPVRQFRVAWDAANRKHPWDGGRLAWAVEFKVKGKTDD